MFVSSLSSLSSWSILVFGFVCVGGSAFLFVIGVVFLFVIGGESGVFFGEVIVGVDVGRGVTDCVEQSSCVCSIVPCVLSSGVSVIPLLRLGLEGHVCVVT